MWISKKDYLDLKIATEKLLKELEVLKKRPYLIAIERNGRENIFTFSRGEATYEVRTMGMLSDNLPEWKKELIR
jgi:hypothetical protein